MSGRASKEKGKTWEREICKILGESLEGNFIRVPQSGAFIGGKNVVRKESMDAGQIKVSKGDIVPPDDMPYLNIEAKNYADLEFHHVIDGKSKTLDSWIDQTETPAEPGDISFTIFKITRKGSWIVFSESLKQNFDLSSYVVYKRDVKGVEKTYIVTSFEKFLNDNKNQIKRLANEGFKEVTEVSNEEIKES